MLTLVFYEINVTNFAKTDLVQMYEVIKRYDGDIVNLEMALDDNDNIVIRGWSTKESWSAFLKQLTNINK